MQDVLAGVVKETSVGDHEAVDQFSAEDLIRHIRSRNATKGSLQAPSWPSSSFDPCC